MPVLLFWQSHDKETPPTRVLIRFDTGLENKMALASVCSKEHLVG